MPYHLVLAQQFFFIDIIRSTIFIESKYLNCLGITARFSSWCVRYCSGNVQGTLPAPYPLLYCIASPVCRRRGALLGCQVSRLLTCLQRSPPVCFGVDYQIKLVVVPNNWTIKLISYQSYEGCLSTCTHFSRNPNMELAISCRCVWYDSNTLDLPTLNVRGMGIEKTY